ncbi:hypothetical protein Pelo_4118 [Pelomyxa schiedti]|nr:hypothetical protein Pelo_4118 [Pelomyxa schiedti]
MGLSSGRCSTLKCAPSMCARGQLAALATSSHARCGARSPARALWLPGSPFSSPSRSFLRRFLDPASFAVFVAAGCADSATVVSATVSRALLGVAGGGPRVHRVYVSDPGTRNWRVPCSPTHLLEFYPTDGEYCIAQLGVKGKGRPIGFKERMCGGRGGDGVLSWVCVSRWMDWAVAYEPGKARTVSIVRLCGDGDAGGSGGDLDSASSGRVQVPLPEGFSFLELLFPKCSRNELVLVGTRQQEECQGVLNLILSVVNLETTFQTKSLTFVSSAAITDPKLVLSLPTSEGFRRPLLLRKRDGSAAFVFPLPEGCDILQVDASTSEVTHVIRHTAMPKTGRTYVTQLNQAAYWVAQESSSLCELWDCNNTERPLKTVSFPECRQVLAGSGFLFVVKGACIQVLDPDSGLVVLTITFPPEESHYFMKCFRRGDIMGVEQLARGSFERDRMILHRALAHGRPRRRGYRIGCMMGMTAIRPPWIPCLKILLNLPGITDTFSCLYEGKSIISLAACQYREREVVDVMKLLFDAGADPNGVEGEETQPFIYSKAYSDDLTKVFLSHPKFNLEKVDLTKLFVESLWGTLGVIFSTTPIGKTFELLEQTLKRLENPDHRESFKTSVFNWATNFGPAAKFLLDNSLCTPAELFRRGLYCTTNVDTITIALNAGAEVIKPEDFNYYDLFRSQNEKLISLLIDKGFPFPDMGEVASRGTEVWNLFKSRGFEYDPAKSKNYDTPYVTQTMLERGDFDEAMRIKGEHEFPIPWCEIIKRRFPLENSINMAEMKRYLDAAPPDTDWGNLISLYMYYRTTEPLRACVARANPSQLTQELIQDLLRGALVVENPVPVHLEKISYAKSLGATINPETVTVGIGAASGYRPPREVIEPLIDDLFGSLAIEQKEEAANKIITAAVGLDLLWVVEKVAKLNAGRLPAGILLNATSDEMYRLLVSLGAVLSAEYGVDYFSSKSRELEAAIGKHMLEHPLEQPPLPEEGSEEEEYDYSLVHDMASGLRLPILKALLSQGWNPNRKEPYHQETPFRAVLACAVSDNDCQLQREAALALIAAGAQVTVDDLIVLFLDRKLDDHNAQGSAPDSIYFAFTKFAQHRIDTLAAVASAVPPALLLSPASAESPTAKRCPSLLWAACLYRSPLVIRAVASLLASASPSPTTSKSAHTTTTAATTTTEATEDQANGLGTLVGQRREKDGLTVMELLAKKGCFECLSALNSLL